MTARSLWVLALWLVTAPAAADIPVPNQELCTVDIQQRDGSHCESCSWVGFEEGAFEEACGPLEERGLTRRCGYGATAAFAVYCDREADFVEVGGGSGETASSGGAVAQESGCGCRAAGGGGARAPAVLAAVALLALRRRRARRGGRRSASVPPGSARRARREA